jgi:hypothetical protein
MKVVALTTLLALAAMMSACSQQQAPQTQAPVATATTSDASQPWKYSDPRADQQRAEKAKPAPASTGFQVQSPAASSTAH